MNYWIYVWALVHTIKGLCGAQRIIASVLFAMATLCLSNAHALPEEPYAVKVIADQLTSPWSAVSVGEDKWFVTEKNGNIVVIEKDSVTRHALGLTNLYAKGQGGLLDIVVSKDFSESGVLYVSFGFGTDEHNALGVARTVFNGSGFSEPEMIYSLVPTRNTPAHFAGRLLLLPDGTLLVSSGDGFDFREQAQVLDSQLGKILRIHTDGSIPSDNPFIGHDSVQAKAVFTLGHRNPQGLVYNPDQNTIYSHEHGPAGGDELNVVRPGVNYGWPVATHGKDYSGARISPFTTYRGMQDPLVDWTPSIAPSSMLYYDSSKLHFPSLRGHLLVTTLVDQVVYVLDPANIRNTRQKIFPQIRGRLRHIFATNQGDIAILGDGPQASLFLITPRQ